MSNNLNNNRVLLAAFPHLPTLLLLAEHALVARLHELVDKDVDQFSIDGNVPNFDRMEEEYPQLFAYLSEGMPAHGRSPSQLCQLAADMYQLAATRLWEDGN